MTQLDEQITALENELNEVYWPAFFAAEKIKDEANDKVASAINFAFTAKNRGASEFEMNIHNERTDDAKAEQTAALQLFTEAAAQLREKRQELQVLRRSHPDFEPVQNNHRHSRRNSR